MIKKIDIAKATNAYPSTITRMIAGQLKTYNIPLAIEVAKLTGKRPIDFISDKIKSLALEIHPNLKNRVKKAS